MKNTEIWNKARSLNLGMEFLNKLDTLLTSLESDKKKLIITDVGCSLPTKDEIVSKVFTKVFRGDVDLRKVFRDEVNDAYYSGALDMHEELTK